MTPNDDNLDRGLRALAEMGPRQAPAPVELALRSSFRKRKARRRLTLWALSVAAVLPLVLFLPRPQPVPPLQPRLAHIAVPPSFRAPDKPPVAPRHRRARPQAPGEIATRFYPLQDAATLSPFEYGTLVRVQLPRSALRVVGLPVNEDRLSERINADVLLGQDGLARAVRFVQ